jgi:hypothetical protein
MTSASIPDSQPVDPGPSPSPEAPARPSRVLSGRSLVLGLMLLGISATVLLFVYWENHTRPFRPLREAIGREFRHSRPNVEGGRPKGRGPNTLRVSMTVNFPPGEDSAQANAIFERVLEIARKFHDLNDFDRVEVNLIQFIPEERAKTRQLVWTANDSGKSEATE